MTVLVGKKIESGHQLTFPLHSGGSEAVSEYGSHGTLRLPGTLILVTERNGVSHTLNTVRDEGIHLAELLAVFDAIAA